VWISWVLGIIFTLLGEADRYLCGKWSNLGKIEPPSFNSKVAVDAQRGNTAATKDWAEFAYVLL